MNELNRKIEQLKHSNRELEVRQNIDALAIVKQTKQGEDKTSDHVLKLKSKNDEY